jgi:hypothetical protein
MFSLLGFLLAQVLFTVDAPPPEQDVSKIEIRVAPDPAQYDAAQVVYSGMPTATNGKLSVTVMTDVSTPKYGWVQGLNSFGLSDRGVAIRLGKPAALTGVKASKPN